MTSQLAKRIQVQHLLNFGIKNLKKIQSGIGLNHRKGAGPKHKLNSSDRKFGTISIRTL